MKKRFNSEISTIYNNIDRYIRFDQRILPKKGMLVKRKLIDNNKRAMSLFIRYGKQRGSDSPSGTNS